jgi:predicted restriction endonuclease
VYFLSERTFLIRVKEDTYIKMLELQKNLRFQDQQDRRRKTMDHVIRYLIRNYEEGKKS